MANDNRSGERWRGGEREARLERQAPRPRRLGDRGVDWQDDRVPERYGGAFEEGYGSGGFGPSSPDPDAFYAAPGHDSGFAGPRFDRADIGSTGTHGVHPVASSSGLGYQGYGTSAGGFRSSARTFAMLHRGEGGQERSGGGLDPHYAEWRRRQIEQLDRDYADYCRERQASFEQDFGAWRERRGEQRSSLDKVRGQMRVVGSDGRPIGTVEKVSGDRLVLARSDASAGELHRSIPCSWIESVEDEVRVNRTADQAMGDWRDEEESGALFERGGESGEARGARSPDRSVSSSD